MGFFSFSQERKSSINWENISSLDQLMELFSNSQSKLFLLFKHSTRCSISSIALDRFEANWTSQGNECALYFVDLLKNRDVSNKIEELTGVIHQSPQVIVIKDGQVIYNASHSSIDAGKIKSILDQNEK